VAGDREMIAEAIRLVEEWVAEDLPAELRARELAAPQSPEPCTVVLRAWNESPRLADGKGFALGHRSCRPPRRVQPAGSRTAVGAEAFARPGAITSSAADAG
jgi:hypothetical protein